MGTQESSSGSEMIAMHSASSLSDKSEIDRLTVTN